MPIFLDSCDVEVIRTYHRMGIVRGVTTNPTIMAKQGLRGMNEAGDRITQIARLVDPLPVSVEVTTRDRQRVIEQSKLFTSWGPNVNVKVTIHGPNGETENLEIVHELETVHDVRVNVTAMMSAQQCFLASLAGATYVSLFGGRVNNMGYNVIPEITRLRRLLDRFDLRAQIIVGSTREVLNVIEWLDAGAHIVTVLPDLIEGMLVHPYSKETVQMFLRDAAALNDELTVSDRARG